MRLEVLRTALLDPGLSDAEVERVAAEARATDTIGRSLDLVLASLDQLEGTPGQWGRPLCGAPGKISSVDRVLADEAIAEGIGRISPTLLEADWIATLTALFYVTPRVASVRWWKWRMVTSIGKGKERWKFSGVIIDKEDGERLDLRTSKDAAPLLLALGERSIARRGSG